jgi:hypothetical protein
VNVGTDRGEGLEVKNYSTREEHPALKRHVIDSPWAPPAPLTPLETAN